MSRKELRQWMAYYTIEPFGEYRQDLRNAILCRIVAISQGVKVNGREPKIEDFMIKYESREQTPEDHYHILKAWTEALKCS